ncbi:MAG: class I SAM-dependent methyltransferase [Aquabacterium sp.]|nr:class I SAM-dependent methyltransferase [Aquabacterium sp.]
MMGNQQAQEAQYSFPYHWLPVLADDGRLLTLGKSLEWGLEYYSYVSTVADMARQRRPSSILDVGCGDGRVTDALFRAAPSVQRCVGVDYSERAIALARMFGNQSIDFQNRPLSEVPGEFDLVTLIEVYEHIPPDDAMVFLRDVVSKLAPGGALLVSVPSVNVPVNEKHYRHFSLELLHEEVVACGNVKLEYVTYCHSTSKLAEWLRRIMINRVWTLNDSGMQRVLIRLYDRFFKYASEERGAHVVALFVRPR